MIEYNEHNYFGIKANDWNYITTMKRNAFEHFSNLMITSDDAWLGTLGDTPIWVFSSHSILIG